MTNLSVRKNPAIFLPIAMLWMRTPNIIFISSIDQSLCWSVTKVLWATSPAVLQGWSAIRLLMKRLWWKEPTKEWFIWKVGVFFCKNMWENVKFCSVYKEKYNIWGLKNEKILSTHSILSFFKALKQGCIFPSEIITTPWCAPKFSNIFRNFKFCLRRVWELFSKNL